MAEMSLSEFQSQNRPKSTSSPKKTLHASSKLGLIICAAVLVGVGFFAGVQYQKGNTKSVAAANTASRKGSNYGGYSGGSGAEGSFRRDRAFGTVTAVNSSNITVQTRNGTTSTYNITSSTTVTNGGQSASVSDIQSGDTVILTLDSSNTQNVTAIMLNPSFGGGYGGFGASGSSSSSPSSDNSSDNSGSANASGA